MFFKVNKILFCPRDTIIQITSNIQNQSNRNSHRFSNSFIQRVRQNNIDLTDTVPSLNDIQNTELVHIDTEQFNNNIIEDVNNIIIETHPLNINNQVQINSEVIQQQFDASTQLIEAAQNSLNQVRPMSSGLFSTLRDFIGLGSPLLIASIIGASTIGIITYLNLTKGSSSSSNTVNINTVPNEVSNFGTNNNNFSILRVQTVTTRTTTVGENLDTAVGNVSSNLFNNVLNGSKKLLDKFIDIFKKKD